MIPLVVLLEFLSVVTLDGRRVDINPSHINNISEPRDTDAKGKLYTDKIHCIIGLTNGTLISVDEQCSSIKARLDQLKK